MAKERAIARGHKPPNISPESLLILIANSTRCIGCEKPLNEGSKKAPHMHHDHETGEVHGMAHSHCNVLEGHLRALGGADVLRRYLTNFFPEVFNSSTEVL